jgi:hypothetical protein
MAEPVSVEHKRKLSLDGEEPSAKKPKVKEDHAPQRYLHQPSIITVVEIESIRQYLHRIFLKISQRIRYDTSLKTYALL